MLGCAANCAFKGEIMRLVIALALVAACSSGALAAPAKKAAAKPSKPSVLYDFKGARLGMTLQEVKALPAPTKPPYESSFTKYGHEKFFCSTDTFSNGKNVDGFYFSKTEEVLGVISCRYGREWTLSSTYTSLHNSFVSIGGFGADDVEYKFLDGRLFQISIDGSKNMLGDVLDGLTAKFGNPDSVVNDTTQNKAGATFPHTEQTWVNPAATVTVEAPWTKIDNMHVSFLTTDGAARIVAKEKELNPSAEKM